MRDSRSNLFEEALFAPAIPDHQLIRKVGGGSYGQVWLASSVTGAYRAIKIVAREDFRLERTFEREFEGLRRFEPISRTHPGLVDILHIGRSFEEGFYYYVMELADDLHSRGGEIDPFSYEPHTLRANIHTGQLLPTDQCLKVGALLAAGLHHLHSRGLTHRDVKPSNVIFVNGVAKLADIGLVAETGQQTFVGTEGFVPPEGPGAPQADIFSLGMVLYEMSTGKDRLDFPELPDNLPTAKEERARWRRLNDLICKCCMSEAKKRYATADEVVEALEFISRGIDPVPAFSPRFLFAGAAAAALVVACLLWFIMGNLHDSTTNEATAGRPPAPVLSNATPPSAGTQDSPPKPIGPLIQIEPSEAIAYALDGRELGRSPIDLGRLKELALEKVEIRAAGFMPRTLLVSELTEGQNVRLDHWPVAQRGWTWLPPSPELESMVFRPNGDEHLSRWPVSWGLFNAFAVEQAHRKDQAWKVRRIEAASFAPGHDSNARHFAVVPEEAAQAFSEWLTLRDRARAMIPPTSRYDSLMETISLGPLHGEQVFHLRLIPDNSQAGDP